MWAELITWVLRLRADRHAATAVEYALIGSLVAGAAMSGLILLGGSLDVMYASVGGQIAAATPSGS